MGKRKWLAWGIVLAAVAAFVLHILLSWVFDGVGSFDQEVVLESAKPIARVSYRCWIVDEACRRRIEAAADPRKAFDWEQSSPVKGGQFTARIVYTHRSGSFHDVVFYPPQLIVLAEFADGTCVCRVVDLPPGQGKERVVVSFWGPGKEK